MQAYEQTSLWKNSMQKYGRKQYESHIKSLEVCYLNFRKRAEIIANQIFQDQNGLTIHDITHIDALWETASLISGPGYTLTPSELFVLGGAILVHDLAMAKILYSEGLDEYKKKVEWRDTLVYVMRNKLGRLPYIQEIENPDEEILNEVTIDILRRFHADEALNLPTKSWKNENNDQFFLIEDAYIRESFGILIGRIAKSHWQSTDDLNHEFKNEHGAPGQFPSDWTINPLKIACLLRVADASHIDDRRAPSFLYVLKTPKHGSEVHWKFQNLLYKPIIESNRLLYTSKRPFKVNETKEWWLCHDTLKMIDHEIKKVNALLSDRKLQVLLAKSVANIDTPDRLVEVIKTDGWLPLDIKVKVTDVASLAKHIGGEKLYGKTNTVPFRELIQNASDAVCARRVLENRPEDWGNIFIRIGKDSFGYYLEIEDTGLGMSNEVLKGPFLDFGVSYWTSELMRNEHPGLLSSGFHPTGQFGIGFFSVFMWSDKIKVITRCYKDSLQDTKVLEFSSGLSSRPILRFANSSEQLKDGGTKIRMWMREQPSSNGYHFSKFWFRNETFKEFCSFYCPTMSVNIYVENDYGINKAISASDWIILEYDKLMKRIFSFEGNVNIDFEQFSNMRLLKDGNGEVVGRACIIPDTGIETIHEDESFSDNFAATLDPSSYFQRYYFSGKYLINDFEPQFLSIKYNNFYGLLSSGGFRANRINSISGILIGKPTSATRENYSAVVDKNELSRWASEQATLAKKLYKTFEDLSEFAVEVLSFGGDIGDLPIAYNQKHGVLSISDISYKIEIPNKIIIVSRLSIYSNVELYPNVFAIGGSYFIDGKEILLKKFFEALALNWKISYKDILTKTILKSKDDYEFARDPSINIIHKQPLCIVEK